MSSIKDAKDLNLENKKDSDLDPDLDPRGKKKSPHWRKQRQAVEGMHPLSSAATGTCKKGLRSVGDGGELPPSRHGLDSQTDKKGDEYRKNGQTGGVT